MMTDNMMNEIPYNQQILRWSEQDRSWTYAVCLEVMECDIAMFANNIMSSSESITQINQDSSL